MKKHFIFIFLTALTFLVGSCSEDSEEPTTGTLAERLQPGTDTRPADWQQPDASDYELRMSVQVELGDTLTAYQSPLDLMCATIDGQVRAVTGPRETGNVIYYPLIIFNNGANKIVALHYYCDRLHRIYTITNWALFNASAAPTGDSGLYRPKFTSDN